VVLADIRMGGVDGNTWCRQIRAGHPAGQTALVACSANVLGDDRRQAHAAGFDAFVPKPVRESELFTALGLCLGFTWTHAAPEAGRAATLNQLQEALDRPVTLPLPPVTWLERVLGHVRVGDVAATRETIGALTDQHLEFEPFLARVRLLASSYRLSDLEALVARALAQAQTSSTNRRSV
jgi:CheY-like chemotaxis protein